MTRRPRGFTVLEFAIALAIAGFVVSAAASIAVSLIKNMRREERRAMVDTDARRLVDFLIGTVQGAGGGAVRPWMALWREEGTCGTRSGMPACGGSDRLTILDIDPARASCSIVGLSASDSTVTVPTLSGGGSTAATCCFDWDGTVSSGPVDMFDGMPLLFIKGDKWIMRRASSRNSSTGCAMGLTTTDYLDFATEPDGEREDAFANFVGGTVIPVRPRTLYVDHATHQLREWFDDNGDGAWSDAEARVVFPGVYDLQIALGYDGNPEDGKLVEGPSTTDEWVGNVGSDTQPAALTDEHLRMLSFGVITGVSMVDAPTTSVSVLNGTSRSVRGVLLRRAQGSAMLRNLLVFF